MEIRYSCNQRDFKRYTTEETRKEFLIENLYAANEVVAVYSHVDRMVTLGCMPTTETVPIDKGIDIWHNFGTQYFLERREIGIFNIGGQHHGGRRKVRAGLQGLPVHHAGDEGSAVRQRRRGESREVLHGVGPGTPGV